MITNAHVKFLSSNIFKKKKFHLHCKDVLLGLSKISLEYIALKNLIFNFDLLSQGICQKFRHGEFSDYSFTIFDSDFYNIDIYIWTTKNTTIHNHNFSGAFKVLLGDIHTEYFHYDKSSLLTDFITEGELLLTSQKTLKKDDIVEIEPFDSCIHRTFHLDSPAITLCIRSKEEASYPISGFLPNGLKLSHLPKSKNTIFSFFQGHFFNNYLSDTNILERLSQIESPISIKLIEGINKERIFSLKLKTLFQNFNSSPSKDIINRLIEYLSSHSRQSPQEIPTNSELIPFFLYRFEFLEFNFSSFGYSSNRENAVLKCLAEAVERLSLIKWSHFELTDITSQKPCIFSSEVVNNSNGLAAGMTYEDAFNTAIMEVIERDTISKWWQRNSVITEIDLANFANDRTKYLKKLFPQLRSFIIPQDYNCFCVATLMIKASKLYYGFSCSLTFSQALEKSIDECFFVLNCNGGKRIDLNVFNLNISKNIYIQTDFIYSSESLLIQLKVLEPLYHRDISLPDSPLRVCKVFIPSLLYSHNVDRCSDGVKCEYFF